MKYGFLAATVALSLTACSGSGGSDNVSPLPTVNAGADIAATEGELVQLSGTISATGGSIDFVWSQVSGPSTGLSGTTTLTPQFRALNVSQDTDLVFRLTATNGQATTVDEVTVTVSDRARINGPSVHGITGDIETRRTDAIAARSTTSPVFEGRDVRTYDGTNNNTSNTTWGATFIQLQRLADSDYPDGISIPAGLTRTNPRLVSTRAMEQEDGVSVPTAGDNSDFLWLWGQFIAHDISLTDGGAESSDINVISGDETFDPDSTGAAVLLFNRAFFDPATSLDPDPDVQDDEIPREQLNEMTSWLDGSVIYGNSAARAEALRDTGNRALLATSAGNLLPINISGLTNAIGYEADGSGLFVAGDYRSNEHLGLAVLHTLFMREHNRLASDIQTANPGLSDDEVFERARRLVVAKLQIITYEEFLPALLGTSAIPAWTAYDDTIDPSAYNAFTTAVMPFVHSMQSEQFLRLDAAGAVIAAGNVELKDTYFAAPTFLTDATSIEPVLRGLAAQKHQKLDLQLVDDLRNAYLAAPADGGLDLAALIIQSGRDHGLPDYNDMREALSLTRATTFADVTSDADISTALTAGYGNPNVVDLWVGGMAEDPVTGSQLGELFQTIMVRQFTELRDGDRFWWENDLTTAEQTEVQGTVLADIIRANTGISTEIQNNVFVAVTP